MSQTECGSSLCTSTLSIFFQPVVHHPFHVAKRPFAMSWLVKFSLCFLTFFVILHDVSWLGDAGCNPTPWDCNVCPSIGWKRVQCLHRHIQSSPFQSIMVCVWVTPLKTNIDPEIPSRSGMKSPAPGGVLVRFVISPFPGFVKFFSGSVSVRFGSNFAGTFTW